MSDACPMCRKRHDVGSMTILGVTLLQCPGAPPGLTFLPKRSISNWSTTGWFGSLSERASAMFIACSTGAENGRIADVNVANRSLSVITRSNCGRFSERGAYGSASDYMLAMYLACADGNHGPDEIRMGHKVYMIVGDAFAAHQRNPPRSPFSESIVELRYMDARVVRDRSVPDDTMRFYRGGVLRGECSGWTAG